MNKATSLEINAKAAVALAQLQFAMSIKDWDSAKRHAEQYHHCSQNLAFAHLSSHVHFARIDFNQHRWKPMAVQFYLALMAPYGTFHRRLMKVGPGEPNPPNLTMLLLKIAHKVHKGFNA